MPDIIHVLQSQASDIKLDAEGKSTFSIRAVAKLADVSHVAIRKSLLGGNLDPSKTAKTLTGKDLEGGNPRSSKMPGVFACKDSRGGALESPKTAKTLAGKSVGGGVLKNGKSGDQKPTRLAEKLISKGFKGGDLKSWTTEGIPDTAAYAIIWYYAFDAGRYCTQQARLMVESLGAVGLRVFAQRALGYAEHASLALPQSPLMAEISALKHEAQAIAAEIKIHEKAVITHQQAIEQLHQRLDDTELKIANAHLELYDPIHKKLEYYENKRLEIMSKNVSRNFNSSPNS
ncbi:hypothetical protein JYQ62_16090 [Nostoc sp. UHCC 0702]|nr:hypothetical protein JYQ62_16090 [Nostoc sp. UHCC 0702]